MVFLSYNTDLRACDDYRKHFQLESLCVFAIKWISICNVNTEISFLMLAENLISLFLFVSKSVKVKFWLFSVIFKFSISTPALLKRVSLKNLDTVLFDSLENRKQLVIGGLNIW